MRRALLACFAIIFALAPYDRACADQYPPNGEPVSISVSLDPDSVGIGEQAVMTVIISGQDQNLPAPEIPDIDGIELYSQGRSSNISIVNGQVKASVTYRFLLLPSTAGAFQISGINAVYNGKRYQAAPLALIVLNDSPKNKKRQIGDEAKLPDSMASGGRDYFLSALVDKKNPYVSEQVTLTLKFCTAVQYYGSPQLTEPTTTGFWTEVLGNSSPYYQKIDGRNYRVIERKYALFPTQTGDLTIGRAVIKATVAGRGGRQNDPFDVFGGVFGRGTEVTVSSQPIRVNVKPLPEQGKPKNFTGTVGKFTFLARADKSEVEVNQPVAVTFQITGNGNIKSVSEPILPDLPDFRTYSSASNESTSDTDDRLGGAKTYEKIFIPKRPGDLEIPSIDFSFFDPQSNTYKTVSTKPIRLKVLKPEGYASSNDIPFSSPSVTVGREASEIRFIHKNLGDVQKSGQIILTSPLYLLVNGLPVLLLAGLVLARRRREHLAANVGYARSRMASREAKRRLSRARSLATLANAQPFHAEIHHALVSYIADKLNLSPHGLSMDRIEELLRERRADDAMIGGVIAIWKQCDFARFAPSSVSQESIDNLLAQTEEVMGRIEGIKLG